MTAEIGRVLGGRYRLVAPIGMGASAQVYLADDVKLRRRVAVKMLHDALAGDREFLLRFRAEARAAAALSHPNVMAVYDWGDDDVAFIVTEYLPGGSLRALLDTAGTLTPGQILGVGLEAARALDYAHRRGFVHRDIKPANLLFGEEQRLRIADFGLARALAEAAWTEPQGAVLGTARYASPEQAKGEKLTGKADVYSLALVMVEAVTGEVPFVADTTLGTLMARVDRQLEVPDKLGALAPILRRAGHPDPEQRVDARGLALGLLRAAKELPRPAPLALPGALAAADAALVDVDPTIHAAGPAADTDLTADDLDLDPPDWVNRSPGEPSEPADAPAFAVPGAAPADEDAEQTVSLRAVEGDGADPSPTLIQADEAAVAAPLAPPVALDGEEDEAEDGEPDGEGGRRRRWPWAVLAALVVLGGGGAATAMILSNREDPPPAPVRPLDLPVPGLVGRTEAEATAMAEASGWTVKVTKDRKDGTSPGEVLEATPEAGMRLANGGEVALVVSEGQLLHTIPDGLIGQTQEEAFARVSELTLVPKVLEERFDEDIPAGSVIDLGPDTQAQAETGQDVNFIVSKGPAPRTVPKIRGLDEDQAKAELDKLRLGFNVATRSYSDDVKEGLIISVQPAEGSSLARGETVNVEVSRGPERVAIPDVSKAKTIQEAIAMLRSAGLVEGEVSGKAAGKPVRSTPKAGDLVKKGSTVNIVLG